MNLLQLRQKFRTISGRFDLVNEDGSDNGADFYIDEGKKFLDRLDETQKSWATCFRFLNVGFYHVTFPYCRAIKEIWASSQTARWQVHKVNFQELVEGYLTGIPSARNTGAPLYYSPCITRAIPENETAEDFESFTGWVDVPSGNAHEFNTILLSVPAEEKLVISVNGLFYSAILTLDTDENYWSAVHPLLLISATMRQIEITNRNTQGVNDWTGAIGTEMRQLGFDYVDEMISEVSQMEG